MKMLSTFNMKADVVGIMYQHINDLHRCSAV